MKNNYDDAIIVSGDGDFFPAIDAVKKEGKRVGYKKINLSDYINTGVKTVTFQMTPKDELYLTCNI